MMLIIGVLASCAAIGFHWISQFLFTSMGTLSRFVIVFIVLLGLLIALSIASNATPEEAFAALIWYGFSCELYVFLFTLSLSSISVKIIQLLSRRTMSIAEIEAAYQPGDMVSKRFERLQAARLIEGENNFTLTAKGKKLVWVFNVIRNILHRREN